MILEQQKGLTFVEILVGVTIFLIVALSIYSMFNLSLRWVSGMKARVEATAIAQEQIETIRNMGYEDVKTTLGWSPPGVIPSIQTISRGGIDFSVNTSVSYVNDPFDGTSVMSVPPDTLPFDYKKVEVKVSWPKLLGFNTPVLFNTLVIPKGLEGLTSGKGGIWIRVFDAQGNGISGANVHVENTNLDPDYIVDTSTNADGNVFLTDLDPDNQNYQVAVSKANYSSEKTYSVNDLASLGYVGATPEKYPLSVIDGQVTEESFSIDLLSNLALNTLNEDIPEEFTVSTDSTGSAQDITHIAIDSFDNMYFVWHDLRSGERNYSQKYDINMVKQWSNDVELATRNNQTNPRVVVGGDGNLYIVWNDNHNGNQDIYLDKYSKIDGTSMLSENKKVDMQPGADSADQIKPDIAADSLGDLAVVWVDGRNGDNDIYMNKLDGLGVNIWTNEIKVNSETGANIQADPIVLVNKTTNEIYAIWSDNRNSNWDIYMNKFDTNGVKLWVSDVLVNTDGGSSNQTTPDAILDNAGNIYIVWSDNRNGVNDLDVYAQKYDGNGVKANTGLWTGGDLRINSDTTTAKQESPSITIDGGNNFFIAWADERNNAITSSDIYLQKFNSDGLKIWPQDQRVNSDTGLYTQTEPETAILSDGRVVIVWQDNRTGNLDVYSAIFSEPGTQVRGNVPLKVYITKTIGTDASGDSIYKYTTNITTDANGLFTLGNIEWGNYRIEVTGGLHTLTATVPLQPVTLNPNSIQSVKLNVNP